MRYGGANKYKSQKIVVDGVTFHSLKEGRRYGQLRIMEKTGAISNLVLQPRFDFAHNGVKLGFYKADFSYTDLTTGERVVEDVKGFKTPIYRLKAKLLKAFHGITIYET